MVVDFSPAPLPISMRFEAPDSPYEVFLQSLERTEKRLTRVGKDKLLIVPFAAVSCSILIIIKIRVI